MSRLVWLVGRKFGKLTVISRSNNVRRDAGWLCICECGKETIVASPDLQQGKTESCGCMKGNFKHGQAKPGGRGTKTYRCWRTMKGRCDNLKDPRYHRYGGRGITYCE